MLMTSQLIPKPFNDERIPLLAQLRIHVDVELQLHSSSDLGGCFGVSLSRRMIISVADCRYRLFVSGFTK